MTDRRVGGGDLVAPPLPPARIALLAWLWLAVTVASLVLVWYGLGPLFQQREQRLLADHARADIDRAANEAGGLPGVSVPTKAPSVGTPVAIVEIGRLQVQQVVVEGVLPSNTQAGPGHVTGTAGPGQPGNSVVVGRRSMFGGPFADLSLLQPGDEILVTTVQGRSLYRVAAVREQELTDEPAEPVGLGGGAAYGDLEEVPDDPASGERVPTDVLYGPTTDDRLTLVTSAGVSPFNGGRAVVVTATMETTPFAPTPQGGRTDGMTGRVGDPSAWAGVLLALLAFAGTVVVTVLLYRRTSARTAYLLTAAPILVFTILLAESLARLLPAWS